MSKLSKKFRQLRFIKFLIQLRGGFFSLLPFYRDLRQWFMLQKWKLKFSFLSRYKSIKSELSNYDNFEIFRPESTFSDFDLGLIATKKGSLEKYFIQVATKEHFTKNTDREFLDIIRNFSLKNEIYRIFLDEVKKNKPEFAKNLIEVIDFRYTDKHLIFISKFIRLTPLFKAVEKNSIKESEINNLIEQLTFYKEIFNKCNLFWLDATPHNIMITQDSKIIPVDYANSKKGSLEYAQKINEVSLTKLKDYLRGKDYDWSSIEISE